MPPPAPTCLIIISTFVLHYRKLEVCDVGTEVVIDIFSFTDRTIDRFIEKIAVRILNNENNDSSGDLYFLSVVWFLSFAFPGYHLQSLTLASLLSLSPSYLLSTTPLISPSSIVLLFELHPPFSSACPLLLSSSSSTSSSFPPGLCALSLCSVVIVPPPGHLTADNHRRRKKERKKAQFLSAATAAIHCRIVNEGERLIAPPSLFLSPSPLFSPSFLHFLSMLSPTAGAFWRVKRPRSIWMSHFEFAEQHL